MKPKRVSRGMLPVVLLVPVPALDVLGVVCGVMVAVRMALVANASVLLLWAVLMVMMMVDVL